MFFNKKKVKKIHKNIFILQLKQLQYCNTFLSCLRILYAPLAGKVLFDKFIVKLYNT